MEVIRCWKCSSESFIADPVSAIQRLDEAEFEASRARRLAEGADMLTDTVIETTNTETSMEAIQRGIQDNFMKSAMKEVDDLRKVTETQSSLVDAKLSDVLDTVDQIESDKATKEEVDAGLQEVRGDLQGLKQMVEDK